MKTKGKVKIGIMGFSNGHCFFLFQALKNEPDAEIVAISFAPRERIIYEKRLGEEAFYGIDIFYSDEEMVDAHPEMEACICGGPNADHLREFRLCAERGIHVISMKVPSYDMDEYDEMIRLAGENKIIVYIELEMRWKASIQRIREIIADGKLGEIQSFTAYNYSHNPMWWNHWMDIPEQSYGKRIPIRKGGKIFRGGALADHPHIFDITRYIFGCDFDVVYAEAAPNMRDGAETEDLVYVIGRLQNGVVVSLDPSYANREPEQARIVGAYNSKYPRCVQVEMQVNGSKGTVFADCYGADYVESMEPGTQRYSVNTRDVALDDQRRIFIREFISDIRNGSNSSAVSFKDHKKTIMVMNAAYDSMYSGQPVKVRYEG